MILQNIGRRVVGSVLVNFPVFCLKDFIINVGLALVALSIVLVIAMCLGRPMEIHRCLTHSHLLTP